MIAAAKQPPTEALPIRVWLTVRKGSFYLRWLEGKRPREHSVRTKSREVANHARQRKFVELNGDSAQEELGYLPPLRRIERLKRFFKRRGIERQRQNDAHHFYNPSPGSVREYSSHHDQRGNVTFKALA